MVRDRRPQARSAAARSRAQDYPLDYSFLSRYAASNWAAHATKADLRSRTMEDQHPQLAPGEQLLAGPVAARFTRVDGRGRTTPRQQGSLYVTSQRLIQVAPEARSIDLRRVSELGLVAGHILVTVARSRGLIIELEGAQELRATIAAAVSARRKRRSKLVPVMARGLRSVADVELVEDAADMPANSPR